MRELLLCVCILCGLVLFTGCELEELTPAEEFAEDNGVSVELAESLETAIVEADVDAEIKDIKDWEQGKDYADGQRYTAWTYSFDRGEYYHLMFYVKDDKVVAIRDQDNGLSSLYEAD